MDNNSAERIPRSSSIWANGRSTLAGIFLLILYAVIFVFIGACGGGSTPAVPSNITLVTGEGGMIDTDGVFSVAWEGQGGVADRFVSRQSMRDL